MRTPLPKHWASRIMATLSLNLAATPTFAASQSSSSLPFQSPSRLPLFTNCSRPGAMFAPLASPSSSRFQASIKGGLDDAVVALEESEEQRLKLDAEARNAMAAEAEADDQGNTPGAWKWAIRKRVWDVLEEEDLAQLPRPVHHRIPNFVGAGAAAAKLASLPAFQTARCVKVNPDTPQKQVRFLTLNGNKILMTPQPRLRTGFFSILEASPIPYIPDACTSAGVVKFGKPISLNDKLKVDLIVIGSVAVDPKTGARLGKGEGLCMEALSSTEGPLSGTVQVFSYCYKNVKHRGFMQGFAELEYGMLRWMGAIDDSTLVVTTVHDRQLVDDIPVEKLLIHDVPVDIICTPTQIIRTNTRIPKPQGIYWDKLSRQKLEQIRVLRDLKKRIEKETGEALPCAADEKLPPLAVRKRPNKGKTGKLRLNTSNHNTIFMWNVSPSTTKRQLEDHIAELGGDVQTVRTSLKPGNNMQMAWVMLKEGSDIGKIIEALDQSSLDGVTVRAKEDEPTRRAQDTSSPVWTRK